MKECPFCQYENPDHAHFCIGCGAEIERQCSTCGRSAPADAKFCPNCGSVLVQQERIPWVERKFSTEVRMALFAVFRGLAVTMFVLAVLVMILTPPPRFIDEFLLMLGGALLFVLAEFLRGRKPKPPDDHNRLATPDEPPDGGIALDIPAELFEVEELQAKTAQSGEKHGPYLN